MKTEVEAKVLYGWSYFGISRIRIWKNDKDYFTIYSVMLTNKILIGISIGGKNNANSKRG